MLTNKFMIIALGVSLALTGCSSTGMQKGVSTDSNSKTATSVTNSSSNKPAKSETNSSDSTQTDESSKPDSSKTANSTESNNASSTSNNSSNKSSKAPAPPQTSQPNHINISLVTAVRAADFLTGWAGGKGWIAKTTNAGKNWSVVFQGKGTVQQITALNLLDVWAALDQGSVQPKLLHSSDGGKHWVQVGTTPNKGFFHFVSKTTGFSGNALTLDGGKTWRTLDVPEGIVGDAYFHDTKNGWAVTQTNKTMYVKRTTDGGKSWAAVMTRNVFEPLAGAAIRSAGTNDSWIELIGGTGMNQTSYSLFHTNDGGKSWRTVLANETAGGGPAPGFNLDYNKGPHNKGNKPGPLYVINQQGAFMGGSCPACDNNQNSIGWTKDGGVTWINSKVTITGDTNVFLAFLDANHGWWITTENEKPSVMYTTTDGGVHWNQAHIFR